MKPPVLLIATSPEVNCKPLAEAAREQFPEHSVRHSWREEEIMAFAAEVEIMLGNSALRLIPRMPRLKWVQQFGTGTEWLLQVPGARTASFTLCNVSDNHCRSIAEHILALVLSYARRLPQARRLQLSGIWRRPPYDDPGLFEMKDKAVLLVGSGSIARAYVKAASGLDFRFIALRKRPQFPLGGCERTEGIDKLHELLPEADIVLNSLPYTQETDRLFGEREFSLMKESAFFVNVGRGATVDEGALVEALRTGSIGGAGLDVFETEPLPKDSPLWHMENVILSAHYAGASSSIHHRHSAVAIDNLRRYAQGESLRNLVDKQRGY